MSRTLTTVLLLGTASIAMAAPKAPTVKPSPAPAAAAVAPAAAPSPAASAAAPAPNVLLKTTEPIHVLALPMKGSYMQHPDAFMQLGEQLAAQGKNPTAPPFSRYFNTPRDVAEAELLWEVCFPVDADVKAMAPAEIKDVPGGLAATVVYKGTPDKIQEASMGLFTWVSANGYRSTGPMSMFFLGEPDPSGFEVELRIPIEKL